MTPAAVIIVSAFLAGLLTAISVAAWPWGRRDGRFAVAGLATDTGFAGWHLAVNVANAAGDVGCGLLAFCCTALLLVHTAERPEPGDRVLAVATIGGLVASVVGLAVP